MASTNLSSLPPEVLRQTALYLPLPDIYSLLLTAGCFRELHGHTIKSPSFAPWRRRFFAYQQLHVRTMRETQNRAYNGNVQRQYTTGGILWERTALEYQLEEMTRAVMGDLGLLRVYGRRGPELAFQRREGPGSSSANSPVIMPAIKLKMVFYALEHLSETKLGRLRLLPLLCPLSKITDILTQRYSRPELIQKFVPISLLPRSSSLPGSVAETAATYKIFTAYLLFTALTPNGVLGVLSDALLAQGRDIYAVRGEQEMAIVEFFHFLRLFLLMYEYDRALRHRGLEDKTTSPQGRKILAGRLDVWIRGYFRPERPLPPPSALATPVMRYNVAQNPSTYSVPPQPKRTSMEYRPSSSGSRRGMSSGSTAESCFLNSSPSDNPGPILTGEQVRIVRTDVISGDLMKVRAYAGTGKTMSLTEYAKARPQQKFLYIAFNKSAQLDAEKKFPRNVHCKTMHAIALRALHTYAPQIKDSLPDYNKTIKDRRSWDGRMPTMEILSSSFTVKHVIEMLQLENNITMITSALINPSLYTFPGIKEQEEGKQRFPTANAVASCVKKTLEKFWSSKELGLSWRQLPFKMIEHLRLKSDVLLKWAESLWEGMIGAKVRYVPHDAYLKLFHLDGVQQNQQNLVRGDGDMAAFGQYDIIMFDEAQDSNPCMADVILRQRRWAGLVVVGDPYQKIYGFRGATNECFDDALHVPTHSFYLTHSFRFGDNIAEVANVFLRALHENVGVNGVRREDSVKKSLPDRLEMNLDLSKEVQLLKPGEVEGGGSGKYTVVFRKNITLIKYALEYCISHSHLNHRIALITARNFNKSTLFTLLRTAHQLFHEEKAARTGILAGYKTWQELTEHVKAEVSESGSCSTDSPGLGLVVGLEGYIAKEGFLHTIATCENMVIDKSDEADVILITTHQAKGQEWDRVVVADDFDPLYNRRDFLGKGYYREEMFMTYVAVTRAKKELIVGRGVAAWLAGEMGAYRFYISSLQGNGKCPACCDRRADIDFTEGEVVKGLRPRTEGVLMGYECLLPVGSFGATIIEPLALGRLPLGDRKEVLACDLCVASWGPEDEWGSENGVVTDLELVETWFPIPDPVSNKKLVERMPLLNGYTLFSGVETRKVLKWVADLEGLLGIRGWSGNAVCFIVELGEMIID